MTPHPSKKFVASEKELRPRSQKTRVTAIDIRSMTESEEKHFHAALAGLLRFLADDVVRQHRSRQRRTTGDAHLGTSPRTVSTGGEEA